MTEVQIENTTEQNETQSTPVPVKRYKKIINSIATWIDGHRGITMIVVAILCLSASYVTFEYSRMKIALWQQTVNQIEADAAANLIDEKAAGDYIADLQKKQIIATKMEGFTTVFNSAEDGIMSDVKTALVDWAKNQGYDGIIIGRIQESFDGNGVQFATFSGKNAVPLKYVSERLSEMRCKNVVSVMYNKTDFAMPYPVTEQTFGDLRVFIDKGFSLAGFGFTEDKVKIKSSNFSGSFDDGELDAEFNPMF